MIEKFVLDKQTIHMRHCKQGDHDNTVVLEENIFRIDSVSLLIGDNGSGKTRLLDAIWNALDTLDRDDWRREWRPVFADGLEGADRVGMILFSHAPDKRRRKVNFQKKSRDVSPTAATMLTPRIVRQYQASLRDIFPSESRFQASFSFNPRSILRRCAALLCLGALSVPKEWRKVREEFDKFTASSPDLISPDAADWWRVGDEVPPIFGRSKASDAALGAFSDELFYWLLDIHGDLLPICLATFWSLPSGDWSADSALIHILCNMLGFIAADVPDEDLMGYFIGHNFSVMRAMFDGMHGKVIETYERHNRITCVVELEDDRGVWQLEKEAPADFVKFSWSGVSSGQWAMITQLIHIEKAFHQIAKDKTLDTMLVLIDEGDAFLHLEWQRNYLSKLDQHLARMRLAHPHIKYVQALVATHSPLLASAVPSDYVNRLHKGKLTGKGPAFAAPFQLLLGEAFNANSIGDDALALIGGVVENLKKGKVTPLDRYIVSIVDDPLIRRELEAMMPDTFEDAAS